MMETDSIECYYCQWVRVNLQECINHVAEAHISILLIVLTQNMLFEYIFIRENSLASSTLVFDILVSACHVTPEQKGCCEVFVTYATNYFITTMFGEMCFKLVFFSKALITVVTPVF